MNATPDNLPEPLMAAIREAAREVKRRADSQHADWRHRLPNAVEDYQDDILTEITAAWREIEEEREQELGSWDGGRGV